MTRWTIFTAQYAFAVNRASFVMWWTSWFSAHFVQHFILIRGYSDQQTVKPDWMAGPGSLVTSTHFTKLACNYRWPRLESNTCYLELPQVLLPYHGWLVVSEPVPGTLPIREINMVIYQGPFSWAMLVISHLSHTSYKVPHFKKSGRIPFVIIIMDGLVVVAVSRNVPFTVVTNR